MKQNRIKQFFSFIGESIKAFFIRMFSTRVMVMALVFIVLFVILICRLFYLQVVRADYYSENYQLLSQRTIDTEGARGNIYDRNGNLLAYNEIAYTVTMTDEIENSSERGTILNSICHDTAAIIEKYGDSLTIDFNIELDSEGNYAFKSDPDIAQITFLCNVFGLTSSRIYEEGYDQYSAAQIIEYMVERYDIDEGYSSQEVLTIATMRYALSQNSYQKYVATEIAEDVSEETKAAILESSTDLMGVTIEETYRRVYPYGEYVASLLGYTGEISESELEEYNTENDAGITYSSGDIVGKSGLEKTYDSYLQGSKGSQTVYVNTTGTILDVVSETPSSSGGDLHLTIDINLQIVAYTVLEQEIASALVSKIVDYDYNPRTDHTGDSYFYIPVKDVYYQLLTNVVDYGDFADADATEREKSVYSAFTSKQQSVIYNIINELNAESPSAINALTDEYYEYMFEVYGVLRDNGVIDADKIDTTDDTYLAWADGSISLREFIYYAIEQNWVDITVLGAESAYTDSDQVFELIISYISSLLQTSSEFTQLIYYYMVYNSEISSYDIIMLLYDQGILEADEALSQLNAGTISTYTYVLNQISNLTITPAMIALDPCSGSVVVTDTDTGKVLAMVSYPSYDNNKLSGNIDTEYWNSLINDDSTPLYNRATQTLTAPGSTYKIVTSVAGLSEGYVTPSTVIHDNITFSLITPSPTCHGHGNVNLDTALAYSCNYYFYQIGYDMGLTANGTYDSDQATDLLTEYAINLGLGIKSGVEIEEAQPSNSTSDSVRTAIGQSSNAYTPAQLARYINTVANKGENYQLSLVDSITDSEGETILSVESVVTNTVELSAENWNAIYQGLRDVCVFGTASGFFNNLETTVAGKTGTAQENLYRSNHVTFIGFAPYEDPQISFACVIRNGDSTAYPGAVLSTTLQYYFNEISYDDVMSRATNSSLRQYSTD